jgi:hypothetical protein
MRVSQVVGLVLVIVGMAAAACGQAQVLRHAAKTPHVSYAVGKGDTLYGVSRRFNLPGVQDRGRERPACDQSANTRHGPFAA